MTAKSHFQDHHHHPLFPHERHPKKSSNDYVIFHKELNHEIRTIGTTRVWFFRKQVFTHSSASSKIIWNTNHLEFYKNHIKHKQSKLGVNSHIPNNKNLRNSISAYSYNL